MKDDFNMKECQLDRSASSCRRLMGLKKELVWVDIKSKYNIEDYSSKNDGPLSSWDNLEEADVRVLVRPLDSTLSLARFKIHLLILCIVKF